MIWKIKVIILRLCAAISATSADHEFKKYLSAKQLSFQFVNSLAAGIYKNWTIIGSENGIELIDVDTGARVKTITGLLLVDN
jgi:hypothetical protein